MVDSHCKFNLTAHQPEDQKNPSILLKDQSSPNNLKGGYDGSTGMKALPKDVQSDYNVGRKASDRKQPSRLTIAQGIANMEIFGSASHHERSVENGREIDQQLLNPNVQHKVQLSQHSELRAAYASQVDRHSEFERASIGGGSQAHDGQPLSQKVLPNQSALPQDSKILTKSTLRHDEMLPNLAHNSANQNNGYISDFYRKKRNDN